LTIVSALAGCDDTRFVGVQSQIDSFVHEGEATVDEFTQAGKERVDAFVQTGTRQLDTFQQKVTAKVDILWVVDNSASMEEEQAQLADNYDYFMEFITDPGSPIDYQIGVITTDMDDPAHSGKLQGNPLIITNQTPNPEAAFANNVQVNISGGGTGGNEMGMLAANMAMTEPLVNGFNDGFLRPDAGLAVIFVTNEDDHSNGETGYYMRFFSSVKDIGNENNVVVAAIAGPVATDGCTAAGQIEADAAYRFEDLISEMQRIWNLTESGVQGYFISICDPEFGLKLNELGFSVAGLSRKFLLSRYPDLDFMPITVMVDGVEILEDPDTGWQFKEAERAIHFPGSYVPPPGSTIVVEYGNLEAVFHLSGRGQEDSITVTVDDVEMELNSDYYYDSNTNNIYFDPGSVPPKDAVITVSYLALERQFPLSRTVENPETLEVEVDQGNGWQEVLADEASGWMFNAATNSILFQGQWVPPLNSKLRVSYANLTYLFTLSRVPISITLVTIDVDGDGPEPDAAIPEYDEGTMQPGWIYYGPDEDPPFSNAISFEKLATPLEIGAVITVTYTPDSSS